MNISNIQQKYRGRDVNPDLGNTNQQPYIFGGRDRGGTVVKVLHYKSEGHWFDSRWCHWNFSLT